MKVFQRRPPRDIEAELHHRLETKGPAGFTLLPSAESSYVVPTRIAKRTLAEAVAKMYDCDPDVIVILRETGTDDPADLLSGETVLGTGPIDRIHAVLEDIRERAVADAVSDLAELRALVREVVLTPEVTSNICQNDIDRLEAAVGPETGMRHG